MKFTLKATVASLALLPATVLGQVPPPVKQSGPNCIMEASLTCTHMDTNQDCKDIPMFDQNVCDSGDDYKYTIEYVASYKNKIQKRNGDNKIKLYRDSRSFAKTNTEPLWIRKGKLIGVREAREFKRKLEIDPCAPKKLRPKFYIGEIQIEGDVQGHSVNGVKDGFHCYGHDFYKEPVLIKARTSGGLVGNIPAPTGTPTKIPTTAPTSAPTIAPTVTPTTAPTSAPTIAPTVTPVVDATSAPTVAPTTAPTEAQVSTNVGKGKKKGKGKSNQNKRNLRHY